MRTAAVKLIIVDTDGINRRSATPIPQQLAALIRARIAAGEWDAPNDRLPPEKDLAAQYQVSKSSLRKALAALKAEGLLGSRQGIANYTVPPGERG